MHTRPDSASTAQLQPDNFRGPLALVAGPPTAPAVDFAASLLLRYSRPESATPRIRVLYRDGREERIEPQRQRAAETAIPLGTD